jgi:hypothetical protein
MGGIGWVSYRERVKEITAVRVPKPHRRQANVTPLGEPNLRFGSVRRKMGSLAPKRVGDEVVEKGAAGAIGLARGLQ